MTCHEQSALALRSCFVNFLEGIPSEKKPIFGKIPWIFFCALGGLTMKIKEKCSSGKGGSEEKQKNFPVGPSRLMIMNVGKYTWFGMETSEREFSL